jgi:hypothetical protein
MNFTLLSEFSNIETIAVGDNIREIDRLYKMYGKGRWRKMKGRATMRLANDSIRIAELHWYKAHGIGKKEMKRKKYMEEV